jgi:hypothetical protein
MAGASPPDLVYVPEKTEQHQDRIDPGIDRTDIFYWCVRQEVVVELKWKRTIKAKGFSRAS